MPSCMLVYTVVMYLKNELNRGDFFMMLRNQPVALSLYKQVEATHLLPENTHNLLLQTWEPQALFMMRTCDKWPQWNLIGPNPSAHSCKSNLFWLALILLLYLQKNYCCLVKTVVHQSNSHQLYSLSVVIINYSKTKCTESPFFIIKIKLK